MIENKQLRFDRSKVAVPQGIPEYTEQVTEGRALRWYVGQITADEVVVEATVDSEKIGEFRESVEGRFHPGRSVAVSIIPTGVGCSIGGYAGDAAPVTRLLSSAVDYLVTNPNAVNASDFAQINDNVLYTEGYCIDLLCRGRIDLYVPYANSVGVIVEKASDARLDQAFNVINAVRAVHGVDIQHCVVTDRPIGSRCEKNETGAFVGTVDRRQGEFDRAFRPASGTRGAPIRSSWSRKPCSKSPRPWSSASASSSSSSSCRPSNASWTSGR